MTPRRWFWPLSPWHVLIPAGAICAIAAIGTLQMWQWPNLHWALSSGQWHQQFRIAGPVAAGAATLWAARLNRQSHVWVQPQARRLGIGTVTRHLGMLCGWFVGAYALGMMPLTVITLAGGAYGGPDVLVMLSGLIALAAATAFGYAVGTVAGSLVAVPLVAIAMYLLDAVAVYGGESSAPLVPQLSYEPLLGEVEPTPLVLFRTMLFVTVAAAGATAAALVLRWRSHGRQSPWLASAGLAACLVPVVVLTTAASSVERTTTYVADGGGAEPHCVSKRGIEYCVHPGNESQLDALIAAIDSKVERLGTTPSGFTSVQDYALRLGTQLGRPTEDGELLVPMNADGSVDVVSGGITEALLNFQNCPSGFPDASALDLYQSLDAYLDTGRGRGVFADMSSGEIKQWIRGHQDKLASCSLTEKDQPQA